METKHTLYDQEQARCPSGQERYSTFYSKIYRRDLVQYDYRTTDGLLFSCVSPSLERARARRDAWLREMKSKGGA